jgi:MSHA pilin protein MshD
MNSRSRNISHGITLVEAIVGSVMIALILVPMLQLIGDGARYRLVQSEQTRAAMLGRELMSEILTQRYIDANTDTGETRSTWDDVDDFNGLNESPPTFRDGTTIPGYTGWRRQVATRLVTPATPTTTSATDVGLKEIVVRVTSNTGRVYTMSALRSNNDIYERRSASTGNMVTTVDISIDPGSGTPITTSVNTVNLTR